jgi:molybdopterin/thiamine biosynthesis adenylyltransferase/SAM-dependent methyltransferase
MTIQLKPYLDIRPMGSSLHVGLVPPSAVRIEDPPDCLAPLLSYLREARDEDDAIAFLAGYGIEAPVAMDLLDQLTDAELVSTPIPATGRYARHLLYFDSIGADHDAAQSRIGASTVAVIGTGGIGSNVATMLVTAGVGRIKLTDGDTVELSNLTRQYLYTENDIGHSKVAVAKRRLSQLNSSVAIETYQQAASPELIADVSDGADLVVLSADSPDEIRLWIDDAARAHGFPYLIAGYLDSAGCVGPLVLPGVSACGMCVIAESARSLGVSVDDLLGPNLNQAKQVGSYGPLNCLVASIAANEALRFLAGLQCETANARLLIDSRNYELTREVISRVPQCIHCDEIAAPSDGRWSTAVRNFELESVYESDRAATSINHFVCDPDLVKLIAEDSCATGSKTALHALDFGCGTGDITQLIASAGYQVVGVDQSAKMIDMATQRLHDLTAAVRQRITFAPLSDGCVAVDRYDLIVCCNVLDHVEDPLPILETFFAGLRATGTLIVTVPHPVKDGGRWSKDTSGDILSYNDFRIAGYFEEGPITKHREDADGNTTIAGIRTVHRTVSTYSRLLAEAGFVITELREPQPDSALTHDQPIIWAKTSQVPYFLTFVATKAPAPAHTG